MAQEALAPAAAVEMGWGTVAAAKAAEEMDRAVAARAVAAQAKAVEAAMALEKKVEPREGAARAAGARAAARRQRGLRRLRRIQGRRMMCAWEGADRVLCVDTG